MASLPETINENLEKYIESLKIIFQTLVFLSVLSEMVGIRAAWIANFTEINSLFVDGNHMACKLAIQFEGVAAHCTLVALFGGVVFGGRYALLGLRCC
jgi:hypothetical protein